MNDDDQDLMATAKEVAKTLPPEETAQVDAVTAVAEQLPALRKDKAPIAAGGDIAGIVPRDIDEAWRLSRAFVNAKMVPSSYDGSNQDETQARVMLGLMKGMEIGLPPVTALSTIMIVNNRPCLWGDGAVALVQRSGKMEYEKSGVDGDYGTDSFVAWYETERRDNAEPVRRTFSFKDAKGAGLVEKRGPWSSGYGPRMCFNRARAWALRDAFSDVLMGIGIVEEVRDIEVEERRNRVTDTSSLDDVGTNEPAANDVTEKTSITA